MADRSRGRRRAQAFQQALERYERALAEGRDRDLALREARAVVGSDARLLGLAANMRDALAPAPEPRAVEMFAARLRHSPMGDQPAPAALRRLRRRPRLGLAPLALAACTVLISAVLIPSLNSLPGDRLYSVKSAAEDARVWFASGPAEARIRVGLAHERFSEVEQLVDRAEIEALAKAAGSSGLFAGVAATDALDDPDIAKLIDQTLAEASAHIEAAAKILIAEPSSGADDLDALVEVSKQGRKLATEVVEELPNVSQPPVITTAVKLARIEAKAKAARMSVEPAPTPEPCATPIPTPEPTQTPGTGVETATPTAVESPSPSPAPTPEPTPCVSPSPTPEPTPTPEPSASPDAGAEAQPSEEPEGNAEDHSPLEVSGAERSGHGSPGDGNGDA